MGDDSFGQFSAGQVFLDFRHPSRRRRYCSESNGDVFHHVVFDIAVDRNARDREVDGLPGPVLVVDLGAACVCRHLDGRHDLTAFQGCGSHDRCGEEFRYRDLPFVGDYDRVKGCQRRSRIGRRNCHASAVEASFSLAAETVRGYGLADLVIKSSLSEFFFFFLYTFSLVEGSFTERPGQTFFSHVVVKTHVEGDVFRRFPRAVNGLDYCCRAVCRVACRVNVFLGCLS